MSEIHAGHRARLTKRVLSAGLDTLPKHEAMEYLLYFALPRGDVNPLAHALIDRFGTVSAVLHAEKTELTAFSGLGAQAAEFLAALGREMDEYLAAGYRPESLADGAGAEATLRRELSGIGEGDAEILLLNSAYGILERVPCEKSTVIRASVARGACAALAAVNGAPDEEMLLRISEVEEALGCIGIPLVNCAFYMNGEIRYLNDDRRTME